MEEFFRKYGLIDDLNFTLKIDKQIFARKLADKVDTGSIGTMSGAFEGWESSNNDYKGQVNNNGFRIRRRKTFFQNNGLGLPIAEGKFTVDGDQLIVDTSIRVNTKFIVPILFVMGFVYLSFISFGVFSINDSEAFFFLPFILLHMALMIGLPYYFMKRGVTRMKKDLERDFFFIASKDS
jgi:hypothetical protein